MKNADLRARMARYPDEWLFVESFYDSDQTAGRPCFALRSHPHTVERCADPEECWGRHVWPHGAREVKFLPDCDEWLVYDARRQFWIGANAEWQPTDDEDRVHCVPWEATG